MSRAMRKGPFVDPKLLKKIMGRKPGDGQTIKTWSRASEIAPEMVGFTFAVHTGKDFLNVTIREEMVGHRLGEFVPTRRFIKHGGKMQRDIEGKQRQGEIDAAKTAKT